MTEDERIAMVFASAVADRALQLTGGDMDAMLTAYLAAREVMQIWLSAENPMQAVDEFLALEESLR